MNHWSHPAEKPARNTASIHPAPLIRRRPAGQDHRVRQRRSEQPLFFGCKEPLTIQKSAAGATNGAPQLANRRIVTAALMLAMFLAAVEGTIVATAMPSIIAALGGFQLYSWVFSIYLLAEAASIPVYGKLADIFGRKPIFVFGTILFLIGTALSGMSQTMMQLIIFRGLQGLGAGAVMPIASTVVSDLYSLRERPRVQGALSSVWAVASVIGPALGGFLVEQLSWHWIFYVNIPFGLLAMLGIIAFLKENPERSSSQIDYAGAALMVVTVGAFMIMLVQGGTAWPWLSTPVVTLLAVSVTGGILFIRQERRAPEPLLPLDLMAEPSMLLPNIGSLLGGGLVFGLTSFIPTFAQGVLGQSATRAGALLTFLSIGWPVASMLTGRAWHKLGHRRTAQLGSVFMVMSGMLLTTANVNSPPWVLGASSFIMGLGLGFSQTTYTVTVQSRVLWNRRGVATSANSFARILGSTLWVALLGGILNQRLYALLGSNAAARGEHNLDVVNLLLDPTERAALTPERLTELQSVLALGAHTVFVVILVTAVAALLIALALPREELVDERDRPSDPA